MTARPWKNPAVMAKVGHWTDPADWQAWWRAHSIAANRLSVEEPEAWEFILRATEQFNVEHSR